MFMIAIAALAAVQGPGPVTLHQLSEARRALDDQLFDYPTARFRDTRGDGFIICGSVNARNRLGAYIGWKRFAVYSGSNDDAASVYVEGTTADADLMLEVCRKNSNRPEDRDWSREIRYQE